MPGTEISVVRRAGVASADTGGPSLIRQTGPTVPVTSENTHRLPYGVTFWNTSPAGSAVDTES